MRENPREWAQITQRAPDPASESVQGGGKGRRSLPTRFPTAWVARPYVHGLLISRYVGDGKRSATSWPGVAVGEHARPAAPTHSGNRSDGRHNTRPGSTDQSSVSRVNGPVRTISLRDCLRAMQRDAGSLEAMCLISNQRS